LCAETKFFILLNASLARGAIALVATLTSLTNYLSILAAAFAAF